MRSGDLLLEPFLGGGILPLDWFSVLVFFSCKDVGEELRRVEFSKAFLSDHQHPPNEGGSCLNPLVAFAGVGAQPYRSKGALHRPRTVIGSFRPSTLGSLGCTVIRFARGVLQPPVDGLFPKSPMTTDFLGWNLSFTAPPCGGRRGASPESALAHEFQSTPPCGGRRR